MLAAGAPAIAIGVLQLVHGIAPWLNDFLINFYDNGRGAGEITLANLLGVGRATSIFGQVSTFGMFSLLYVALVVVTPLSANDGRASGRKVAFLVLGFSGGVASGSKVFSGGILLLAVLSAFTADLRRRVRPGVLAVVVAVGAIVWLVLPKIAPTSSELFESRLSARSSVSTYLGSRFAYDAATGLEAKVVRTGAATVAKQYPVAGIGYFGVGLTTDSMTLGLVVMSGVIGLALFTVAIASAAHMLLANRRVAVGGDQLLASVMLLLLIIFSVASVGFHTFVQDRAGDLFWLFVGAFAGSSFRLPRPAGVRTIP